MTLWGSGRENWWTFGTFAAIALAVWSPEDRRAFAAWSAEPFFP